MTLNTAQERHRTTGRNDACPCGSGKKYKKCHKSEDDAVIAAELTRLSDAAEAEAKAAAEAEEGDAPKGNGTRTVDRAGAPRRDKSAGQPSARAGKADKKSLPRRAAV